MPCATRGTAGGGTRAPPPQEAPWVDGCPESRTDLMANAEPLGTALKCARAARCCVTRVACAHVRALL